jgi:hypothetical protein
VTEPPPRGGRGPSVLTLLLAVGLAIATALAVVFAVSLQAARERIEELEEAGQPTGGGADPLEDVLEGLLGEGGLEGIGGLTGCIGPGSLGGETIRPPSGPPEAQVRTLADEVEDIRELEFRRPVRPIFLGDEAIRRRIRRLFLEDYTPEIADRESRILSALGAVPPALDLIEARSRALSAAVAGFYVPETGELVVRTSGGDLGPLEWVTLVHELEHALADQRLDLPIPEEARPGREDSDLAALAVVEGDATLTMQRYSSSLPFDQQLGLFDLEAIAEAEAGLAGFPHFLEQELLFPYEDGLVFVCRLYESGGWAAVDRAYARPPTTTAQILFPERYARGEAAVDAEDTGSLPEPWTPEGTHEFGAAMLLWLLEAPGGDPGKAVGDPEAAAEAWAGGEVRLWSRGESSAVGLSLAEREEEDVLCPAVSRWYAAAFPGTSADGSATNGGLSLDGDRQDAWLVCEADDVRLGIAPDLATARRLAG